MRRRDIEYKIKTSKMEVLQKTYIGLCDREVECERYLETIRGFKEQFMAEIESRINRKQS